MPIFDDNEFPLAYLITFRCYGTWLHADARGSVDRRQNIYRTPRIPTAIGLEVTDKKLLRSSPVTLDARQRPVVEKAIREVCTYRGYSLRAINVRTNHVHVVVSAACVPERVMDSFKSYATRAMRESKLLTRTSTPWARHGSTRYLWTQHHVERAIDYVLNSQGDDLFRREEAE
jgi:REP element-mobilizing transposase RayT